MTDSRRNKASEQPVDDALVPRGLQVAGAWSWRLLAIAAALGVIVWLVITINVLVVPILVAVLLAALLTPVSQWLQRRKFPKLLAVSTSILGLLLGLAGLLTLVIRDVRNAFPELKEGSEAFYETAQQALSTMLGFTGIEIASFTDELTTFAQANTQLISSGLISVGSTAGTVVTGLVLALFTTIFFLIDGKNIWGWLVRIFPKKARPALDGAGQSGWKTLMSFVKTQVVVAGVDAVGIGLGALILQVPLALPIAVIVFLGSFIPIVGAIFTGILAVFIALIFEGPVTALIMLGVVLFVQQLESQILQPFLIGRAVSVHPLAIILAVTAGALIAGIPGALFAVPIIAVLNTMVVYIAHKSWHDDPTVERPN